MFGLYFQKVSSFSKKRCHGIGCSCSAGIKYISAVGSTTIASTDWTGNIELFPAEVQKGESDAPKFVTAYGTSVSDGTKKGEYIEVGDAN